MKTLDFDITVIRKQFPMSQARVHAKPLVYLDSAATTLKPYSVINTSTTFYKNSYATVHRALYATSQHATELYETVRKKAQSFLHAKREEEIVFVKGTTEGINLVAHSFSKAFIKPGDTILISAIEHHSNIVPWQIACEDRGATLTVIPVGENGELDFQAFLKLLEKKPKIVSLSHVSNTLGKINPIKDFIREAHKKGAKVLIDGAQAAPHMRIDVQDLDCDFYTFSSHKMYGPTGVGILYGKYELLEKLPPYQGGGDMIEEVCFDKTTYALPPLKFEAGTPQIAQVISFGAALDFLHEVDQVLLQKHTDELIEYLWQELSRINGLTILGDKNNRTSLITFSVEDVHPLDAATLLDLQGIAIRSGHLCAQPTLRRFDLSSALRVSLGMYTTQEELEFFISNLQKVVSQLRK